MNNLKQAQFNYDNQLPPDTTERDELVKDMAEVLIEYEVVGTPDMLNYIYLDDLENWIKSHKWKSISTLNKIHQYKQLQLDLCECMITELLNDEGE